MTRTESVLAYLRGPEIKMTPEEEKAVLEPGIPVAVVLVALAEHRMKKRVDELTLAHFAAEREEDCRNTREQYEHEQRMKEPGWVAYVKCKREKILRIPYWAERADFINSLSPERIICFHT